MKNKRTLDELAEDLEPIMVFMLVDYGPKDKDKRRLWLELLTYKARKLTLSNFKEDNEK